MLKHGNQKYNSNVPYKTGDRYYVQDNVLDFRALQDFIGGIIKDVGAASSVSIPLVISGGVVTKGAGDTLDITAGVGYAEFEVEIPDSFASTPPSKTTTDLQAIRVEWAAQNDMAITSATLDGATTNYVKVAYAEDNGNTRNRAKSSGSYAYENEPSYVITVDSDAPTDYEICIASFTGTAGGSFTINNSVKNSLNLRNSNEIAEYNSGTTYSADDEVMYLGRQYISMKGSNTGKDPLFDLDYWMPQPDVGELLKYFRNGLVQRGGVEDVHNHRDAGYRQYFSLGKVFFSGSNGGGRAFQAWGVHLDGTTETGDADLEAILADGESNEYPFIDIFCPDSMGTRTFLDYRGRVPRAVDGTGGDTGTVGTIQEDQMQGHWHNVAHDGGGATTQRADISISGNNVHNVSVLSGIYATDFVSNGTDGVPRTGSETRAKNWTEGVPYIIVLTEIVS